ncbi:inositol polyphosphate 5-phosphatase [Apophysomyces ossiformis]|uniref:phosphoinositide 5-phosphatase n=1 Tax=Apophysomyces ossiformis TaxID=679940 RepID=A0A8H7BRL3_9FUNG|nr:inositol polyphosphate 5-phosphatase [Apophysomyces ossiformis]
MQNHLLLREHPRALALRPTVLEEAPSGVLVFEQHTAAGDPSHSPTYKAVAKLLAPSEFEDSHWEILNARPVFGCLGLINVQGECFIAIVTDCVSVGRIRAGEEVYQIQAVSFYSLSSSKYDNLEFSNRDSSDDEWGQPDTNTTIQHPCAHLQKLFSVGNFYFTPDFDLTRTVQARTSSASLGVHAFDEHFLWNKFLILGLLDFRAKLDRKKQMDLDRGGFLVFAVRGYIGVETIKANSEKFELSVISKLSCKRAGTRFNSRGIDDNGHVANFVETEVVLYSDRMCYAFTQVRGSVPGATQPAVNRHFRELVDRYNAVCNINLLSDRDNTGESLLGTTYNNSVRQLQFPKNVVRMINFDLHAECRGGNYDNVAILMNGIRQDLDRYEFFLMDTDDNRIVCSQKGVFRTNCMDCLDRTNLVQNEISKRKLLDYLNQSSDRRRQLHTDQILARHAHLWAENGDELSKIYAGTGALKSAFTRTGKVTFMNVLSDATRSVNRFYINNFQDKARQEVIDQLLGKLVGQKEIMIHDPISESVSKLIVSRIQEYSTSRKITIFAGSYNLNGKPFKGELLDPWLLQHFRWSDQEPDIYVVGFQEIVELSPQQVMATDAEKRKVWENQIERTLNSRKGGKAKYVLLRSNQLVGAALIVYVKADIVENIRNVESAVKKTGIMGIAGNKGAVAIRMDYGDTSFCFLAAHFASGHANCDDRNADFHTIVQGLSFFRGRTIDDHDNIIWVSDLNYRVSLGNEEARAYARDGNIQALLEADQLQREMREGRVFQKYEEGPITFLPTYKYDNGTDIYDTSEKQRVPGWTDRIIYKGNTLKQLQYARAELRTSDHRPVLALFEANIVTLDRDAKEKLQKELYQQSLGSIEIPTNLQKRKTPPLPTRPSKVPVVPVDTLIDVKADTEIRSHLPPPSSDTNKWWENGVSLPKADKRRVIKENPFEEDSIKRIPSKSITAWTPISPISIETTNGRANSPGAVALPSLADANILSSIALFIIAVAWILILPYEEYSKRTYISENALLPAQVNVNYGYNDIRTAEDYRYKIQQIQTADTDTRAAFIQTEFRRIGFTSVTQRFEGHAKDIILLVTDKGVVGTQAWLEAYHGIDQRKERLDRWSVTMPRSGAIQGVINLDFPGVQDYERLGIFFEGVNGQLPNLDLINSIVRIARSTSQIPVTLHDTKLDPFGTGPWGSYLESLNNILQATKYQVLGHASSDAGLYLRYKIDAVTIHGVYGSDRLHHLFGFYKIGV